MDNPFEVLDSRLRNVEALLLEVLQHLRTHATTQMQEVGGIDLAQQITRLSKARLYALVSARQIPHAKRGNKLYFNRMELQAWITTGSRPGRDPK
ncbi:helix-turn-helix domain-containing protein [Hymenobacter sp. BT491]|uniref:helix-turn-helix domain-containing protein n=1 Tax=Hymenobacter sp. BT491 TaxID=2766779 RepID=UPI0016537ED4|nr:helix-turn-helix domain-containing protein [Hymenobacter sp. BT491]MBC6992225.1 helix-turn-helix domain-containing protein [Hymenobacter sp. BT491]